MFYSGLKGFNRVDLPFSVYVDILELKGPSTGSGLTWNAQTLAVSGLVVDPRFTSLSSADSTSATTQKWVLVFSFFSPSPHQHPASLQAKHCPCFLGGMRKNLMRWLKPATNELLHLLGALCDLGGGRWVEKK